MAGLSDNQLRALALAGIVTFMTVASIWPGMISGMFKGETEPSAVAAPKLTAGEVAQCRKVLAAGFKSGVIRERRSANRIDVDDLLWAGLDARTKDRTLQALACDIWETAMPPPGEFVVSYGYRSGKRIEMLSEMGVDRE